MLSQLELRIAEEIVPGNGVELLAIGVSDFIELSGRPPGRR
jgi:hypothetical protein